MDTLNVNELDFDEIKANLLEYLQGQSELDDYDFTGSALNTIMDACAYVIHYVGVQSNFALRESFLESAQLRKNVAAKAKELGYFPSQIKASRANFIVTLDLSAEDGDPQPTTVIIPKGTVFVSTLENGESISFVTFDDNPLVDTGITAGDPATEILTGTVYIAQGAFAEQSWTKTSDPDQRFFFSQNNIDTDFLTIDVRPNEASMSTAPWQYAGTLTRVTQTSETFFLSESGDTIEVYFGNNIIGKALIKNNYITANYLVSEGAIANGLKTFSLANSVAGYDRTLYSIPALNDASVEGSNRESIESIRFLAPLSYQRQNRIVTADDYKAVILESYPNIKAVNVWGGEDAEPPEYGKVFVSVAPTVGNIVSPATKKSIEEDILSRFNVVGIIPEIIDPDRIEVNLNTTVYYNKDKTILNTSQIATLTQETIVTHFKNSIFDYEQSFKYSKVLAVIDAVDSSIVNSLSDVSISKEFTTVSNVVSSYSVAFQNALDASTITSNQWLNVNSNLMQLKDNGNGKIDTYTDGVLTKTNVGTVDYSTGIINLPSFNPFALTVGQKIKFTGTPAKLDVDVKFNHLAVLGTNSVTVTAVEK